MVRGLFVLGRSRGRNFYLRIRVSESLTCANEQGAKQQIFWAKLSGEVNWYAIPQALAASFRNAGAEVRHVDELHQ